MAVKKRYSIMVVEHRDEYELCQCDSEPDAIAQAATNKKNWVISESGTRRGIPKYSSVRIVENKDADAKQ